MVLILGILGLQTLKQNIFKLLMFLGKKMFTNALLSSLSSHHHLHGKYWCASQQARTLKSTGAVLCLNTTFFLNYQYSKH